MSIQYKVKRGETLGVIARKHRLPSWKYLYQLNRDVIGDNPDLLNEGAVLNIPVIEESKGFQLFRDKDVNPDNYLGGLRYIYPWVTVSFTLSNPDGTVYIEFDNDGKERAEFLKKKKYEIKDADTGMVLITGEITKSEEIQILVPDVKRKILLVDGFEYRLWNGDKEDDRK
ncbi:MAG TPA: LysM domain-containing protein [Chitinispirillaceae bacterium]|nr:LysM domain-containing protein [Chitinispirillaceae bacterium]